MGVQKSAYRQPVTPEGLKAIEEGKLTWLDDEMYNNLNTGVLEQYLEEKNLEESFEVSHWNTDVSLGSSARQRFDKQDLEQGLSQRLATEVSSCTAYLHATKV